MATVQVVDRSSLFSGMYEQLALDPRETALVTIDMHRGHLDMDVATMDRLTPGRKSTVREHNIEGSPGTQIIPLLGLRRKHVRRRPARPGLAEHRALPGVGHYQ